MIIASAHHITFNIGVLTRRRGGEGRGHRPQRRRRHLALQLQRVQVQTPHPATSAAAAETAEQLVIQVQPVQPVRPVRMGMRGRGRAHRRMTRGRTRRRGRVEGREGERRVKRRGLQEAASKVRGRCGSGCGGHRDLGLLLLRLHGGRRGERCTTTVTDKLWRDQSVHLRSVGRGYGSQKTAARPFVRPRSLAAEQRIKL